jgi:hypothetical protein
VIDSASKSRVVGPAGLETKQLLDLLDSEIRALIEKYHTAPAVSRSSFNETQTGNRYQSLNLRGEVLKGFRAADRHIYTGLPLTGLSLVDLGSNTGEKTRYAADAGTAFAEGIEYEELFVRIGNLVSAYNRYGNVVLRQGDMTKPGLLKRNYDVGASFSSFVYLKETLEEILARIDRMFICETHALGASWFSRYVRVVSRQMPYWLVYGLSDHGGSHTEGRRGLLLFSKEQAPLTATIFARAAALPSHNESICQIDVDASARPRSLIGKSREGQLVAAELRERLADIAAGDRDGVVAELHRAGLKLQAAAGVEALRFGSDQYWSAMFQGVDSYHARGEVTEDNIFLEHLRAMAKAGQTELADIFSDRKRAAGRVAERIEGFLAVLTDRSVRDHLVAFNPIQEDLIPQSVKLSAQQKLTSVYGESYTYHSFDGYHRLAACWLARVPTCTVYFCWTNVFGMAARNFAPLAGAGADASNRTVEKLVEQAVLRFARRQNPPPAALSVESPGAP